MLKEFCVENPQQSTEYIVKLQSIADSIHNCHIFATKAKIAGNLIGILGGILSFAGLFTSLLSPEEMFMLATMGFVGGAICLTASAFDYGNQFSNRENVKEIVQSYQEMQANQADKLIQFNQVVQAFNQIKVKNIPDMAFLGMFCSLLDFVSILSDTILMLRKLSGILAVLTVWWNISSYKENRKELWEKIEISQMIQQIAESMEDERFHFKKA